MPAVTPSFIMDLESNMQSIMERDYLEIASNLWWSKVARTKPVKSKRQIIPWIINSAQIESEDDGGNISFDDMLLTETEYTVATAGKGLKLRRQQFEDLDGNGVDLASEWAAQIGEQQAYWPQKQVATFLKNGALSSSLAYDKQPFFSASHLVNPKNSAAGTYSNLITGVRIDPGVTLDVALANLQTVFTKIGSIKMPNGNDPRLLRPVAVICNPTIYPRAVQLLNAKTIGAPATGGAGTLDVEGFVRTLGYGEPIFAPEFAGFESDTTYFVVTTAASSRSLGGLLYLEREPFSIRYYTGRGGGTGVDAALDRADELEWHTSGRNACGYGHPFGIFKCTA